MAQTTGMAGTLERVGPVAGDAGGLLLFGWWMFSAVHAPVPGALLALSGLLAAVLVGAALVGYQLRQADSPSAWLGWAGITVLVLGFAGNPTWVPAGLALFGLSVLRGTVFPRLPGVLMAVGGWMVLVTMALTPSTPSGTSPSAIAWRGAMSVGLVLVAGALADLDALTDPEKPRRRAGH
jgi:hypothetical protein